MADESVVVKMVRTTQPDWSEGTLLYLKSFFGGEVGKNDKNFHKSTGTEGKDIQEGEDREAKEVLENLYFIPLQIREWERLGVKP